MSATGSERVTRTRAGPSKPAPKPKRKQAKEVPEAQEDEESDDPVAMVPDDSGEDDITEVDPPRTRKPASRAANGKPIPKGKGKAKADSAPTKKIPSRADIEMVDDDEEAGPSGTAQVINNATASNRAIKASGRAESSAAATKQIDQLRRQLESSQARVKDLAKQLEESYRVRHTEPEQLQQRQSEKYEEIIRMKDLLLKQQEEMLSHKEPLSKEGKSSVLHMITREQADAEKRSAEEQVIFWKAKADEREQLINALRREKDKQISDLDQINRDLQYEIKAEREALQKASRNPPSASRGRGPHAVLGSDDPKHSELIQFYEDVTNLLVTDIKIQEPKYFDCDEWSLTCIYTYVDKSGESRRSLGFLLRFTYDPIDASEPIESKADIDRAAQYTPLDLDKEKEEFVEALGFLNAGFTFQRTQLPLFFSSLVDNMKTACEGEESETGSNPEMEGVQLVE
ncbi:hypothetical protein C8R43DRAFT_997756 [Mycena crocata]|nr:hypothetical protein C8R43DRAFT_997756 [Mycena crocata]